VVKTKFKKSGIFKLIISVISLIILLVLTLALSASVFFGSSIIKKDNTPVFLMSIYIAFFYIMIVWVLKSVFDRAYIIEINTETKTISFKRLATFQTKTYQFSDFDSYFDIQCSNKAGTYREAYLLRNGKAEKIICGLYYANIDELISALYPIKYDGFKTNNSQILRHSLFNSRIKID
jgi:hypothetical protein